MQFFKMEYKSCLYNHLPHQHSWQTKAINTTFLASSLLERDERQLDFGASHLQESRMERNMKYLLVTLEIEGGEGVKFMWLLQSNSFGIGLSPGLGAGNYDLSLTTVLAGVSAGLGGTEGEKGY